MKLEIKPKHIILSLTQTEFDTIMAAMDSVSDGTLTGAYMDVPRLNNKILKEYSKQEVKNEKGITKKVQQEK